ncbi:unnamed protein product, partial [Ectocarpus fasciculatus]
MSSSKKDFYSVLGVSKNISKADLKKEYFKLAKKYHPDVNKEKGADVKFKEISEAYEILSDDNKRQMYDAYGHAGVDPNMQQQGGNPFEGFGGFGGGFGGFGGGGQHIEVEDLSDLFEAAFGGGGMSKRGRDIQTTLRLSFLEAVNGCTKDVTVSYMERTDNGRQKTRKTKTVSVSVPAGVQTGMSLRVQGKGTSGAAGHRDGDLLVELDAQDDPYFNRRGADVHVEIPVPVTKAMMGCQIDVLTLTGMVEMKVPAGSQPGAQLVMKGKGIKNVNSITKGNQYVHIKVELPKSPLTDRQKELLAEFEAIEEEKKVNEKSKVASTIEKAWE